MYDSTEDTMLHKSKVTDNINSIIRSLVFRSINHDNSKLSEDEKPIFDKVTPALKTLTYGSDEYKEQLKKMNVALKNHYTMNSHHPEHFVNGINGMSLVDVVEMICDWVAASERHDDGDIFKSIEINQERFGYSDDLKNILINTVKKIYVDRILAEDREKIPDDYNFEVGM